MLGVALGLLASSVVGCGGAPSAEDTTPKAAEPERKCTAALRFTEPSEPADPDAAPRTAITLVLICDDRSTEHVSIGEETGACYGVESLDVLLRTRCWWGSESS